MPVATDLTINLNGGTIGSLGALGDIINIGPGRNTNITVGGDVTIFGGLGADITVADNATLTVPQNRNLTVRATRTLTNSGIINNNGEITNNGTITIEAVGEIRNSGIITGPGGITNNGGLIGCSTGNISSTISGNLANFTGSRTFPGTQIAIFGQTLANVTIIGGTAPSGFTFEWVNPAAYVGSVGTNAHQMRITLENWANYNPLPSQNVDVEVGPAEKATLIITDPGIIIYPATTAATLTTTGGSGDGAVTWEVTDGDAATIASDTGVLTITGLGTITVEATKAADGNFNAATATREIMIHSLPTITTQPQSQTIMPGGEATFTAVVAGTPAPALQWQYSTNGTAWNPIDNETNAELTISNVTAAMDGNRYRLRAENVHSYAYSETATLTVHSAPVITTQPASQTIVHGESVTFTTAATGNPAPTFEWEWSADGDTWNTISDETSATLALADVQHSVWNGRQIRAIAVNTTINGATNRIPSNAATFTVTNPVTSIMVQTQPTLSYTVGDDLDLSAMAITLTSANGATNNVNFADFAGAGLSANPTNGTVLTAAHDGITITVTLEANVPGADNSAALTAQTNALTVTRTNPTVAWPADSTITATFGQRLSEISLPNHTIHRKACLSLTRATEPQARLLRSLAAQMQTLSQSRRATWQAALRQEKQAALPSGRIRGLAWGYIVPQLR